MGVDDNQEACRGVHRHRLARTRRVRVCRARGGVSAARYRLRRRVAGVRADGADDGLRARPRLGCHLNPAVSVGLWAGGRFQAADLPGYIIAQLLGGFAGAGILYVIASGHPGFDLSGGFASNGYGAHPPGNFSLGASLVCEVVMTFVFIFVIMGSTHGKPFQRSTIKAAINQALFSMRRLCWPKA